MEKRSYQITELRTDDGAKARGYAAVFNSNSDDLGGFVERIDPGAFTRSLQEAASDKLNIFALWSHQTDQPLASTRSKKLALNEDAMGLSFEMDVSRMSSAQLSALTDGDLQMSFGFSVREQEWRELEDGSVERTLIDVHLAEISFVINPAYPDTSAALRSLNEWRSASNVEVEVPETTKTIVDNKQPFLKRMLLREIDKRQR